jgi:hypothetical protein
MRMPYPSSWDDLCLAKITNTRRYLPFQNTVYEAVAMNAEVPGSPEPKTASRSDLPLAAQRALKEAEARRAEAKPTPPRELNGRGGLDPVRYGDWEVKGIASDF